jgi:O-antigen/teichoic acid export membrane protein
VVAGGRTADAWAMFESGIGPGVRSDRFGTWSLITFLLVFLPFSALFLPIGLDSLAWIPVLACIFTTLAAIGCGLVGIFSRVREQRRSAWHGLLKAAVPTLVGSFCFLVFLALVYGTWE